MSKFYSFLNISRQSHTKARKRNESDRNIFGIIRDFIQSHRQIHCGGGLKKLYKQMPHKPVGRDKFIAYAMKAGLGQKRKKKHIRTTYSVYTIFKNLLAGQTLTGINQAWSGDITYIRVGKNHAYLFLLMDIYSRRILGYIAADSMMASVNIQCLKMAIRQRKGLSLINTIHHSDRGSQYIAGDYLSILQDNQFQISMCNSALDNPYSERINGILKIEYLDFHQFENLQQLKKIVNTSIKHYNHIRPHLSLNMMTPVEFELYVEKKIEHKPKPLIIPKEH